MKQSRVTWIASWLRAWALLFSLPHRENSPITQTTPEPTLSSWGGWPREKSPPHPWPHNKPGLIALIGPLRPYCSQSPLILLRCITEIKFAQNLCWLGNTLVLTFPAHWISNQKLNGIYWTNISKVALNATSERPLPFMCATDPLLGQGVGGKCAVGHESVVQKSPSGWSPYEVASWAMKQSTYQLFGSSPNLTN